jgi:uncharacterized membrane protein
MASILLVNDNKIVSRLLQLSSEKNGYTLKEVATLDGIDGSYDVVFVDSDRYSDELMGELESKLTYSKLGYIGVKQETAPEGFSLVMEKPFLPTDFVDIIKANVTASSTVVDSASKEIDGLDLDDETALLLEEDSLDLDDLDEGVEQLLTAEGLENDLELEEIGEFEELDSLDELEDELDLSLDPSTVMTTGVAAAMAASATTPPEELAEMVTEIEEMEEIADEPLASLEEGLDPLVEEEVVPLELDAMEEVAVESLEDTVVEELKEDDSSLLATAAAGVAAVGAVASQVVADKKPVESLEEEIDSLNDIDNLKETDLQQALGEEVSEIIHQEVDEVVPTGDETLVESNDVEAWIRDAVQKAITPQMIQEALNGMDINVNLTFNTKKDNTPS